MISIKFPPLQKLVVKDTAELLETDPKRGVVVLSEHAIVVTEQSVVFFNLKTYFMKVNAIEDERIMSQLSEILDFMDGHMFSVPFWEELTKGAVITVDDNVLKLDGAIRKDLIYKPKMFSSEDIVGILENNIQRETTSVPRSSFFLLPFFNMLSVLKSFVKNDSIAMEYVGINTMIRFTFNDNPWIFGLISSDPMLNSKNFLFSSMALLLEEISE